VIEAREFVDPARERGLDWYAGVPCSFLTPFIDHVIDEPRLEYLSSANEGDALAACAGAWLGGRGGVAMMQNSGLGNAVSPITSLAHTFRVPVLLIVTLRGEPGLGDEPQHALMGRITGALLDTMEVPWEWFPTDPAGVEPVLDRVRERHARAPGPCALVMRRGSVAKHARAPGAGGTAPRAAGARVEQRPAAARVARRDALARIVERTGDERTVVIATTGYTGRELYALADRASHLYVVGSMGCASSLALGLALARPDLRVVVVDGDGAALMRMGNLATIGARAGANLVHVVLDNHAHESTGGQATVSPAVSFAGVAASCGYARALAGEDPAILDEVLAAPAAGDAADGPRLAHLRIRTGTPERLPRPAIAPPEVCRRLREHIGAAA